LKKLNPKPNPNHNWKAKVVFEEASRFNLKADNLKDKKSQKDHALGCTKGHDHEKDLDHDKDLEIKGIQLAEEVTAMEAESYHLRLELEGMPPGEEKTRRMEELKKMEALLSSKKIEAESCLPQIGIDDGINP